MADAAEQQDFVDLESLAGPTPETQSTPAEFGLDVGLGDLQARGQTLDDHDKGLTMRFTGGQVAQHVVQAIGGGVPVRALLPRA